MHNQTPVHTHPSVKTLQDCEDTASGAICGSLSCSRALDWDRTDDLRILDTKSVNGNLIRASLFTLTFNSSYAK